MRTSRTPHAVAPVPYGHRPPDRLVASRSRGPRGHAGLRLVPDVPAAPAVRSRPAPGVSRPSAPPARPRRSVPEPATPVRPAPIRLTRRGRVVLVLFLAAVLLVTGWFVSRAVASAATTSPPSAASVEARPGDTLWSIAVRARPDTDPRITVERILEANGLASPVIQPGQRLILPQS